MLDITALASLILLGWPESSFGFFYTISWKNLNEILGQPDTSLSFFCSTSLLPFTREHLKREAPNHHLHSSPLPVICQPFIAYSLASVPTSSPELPGH